MNLKIHFFISIYLEQSLLLHQRASFLQGPEVQMRLATGHYDVAVSWVKVCSEHRLIGALSRCIEIQLEQRNIRGDQSCGAHQP